MNQQDQVNVKIIGHDYRVACPPGERESLLKAADLLNQQMEEIRSAGKVIGTERIAVIVALNLAHQSIESQRTQLEFESQVSERLQNLRRMISVGDNTRGPKSAG